MHPSAFSASLRALPCPPRTTALVVHLLHARAAQLPSSRLATLVSSRRARLAPSAANLHSIKLRRPSLPPQCALATPNARRDPLCSDARSCHLPIALASRLLAIRPTTLIRILLLVPASLASSPHRAIAEARLLLFIRPATRPHSRRTLLASQASAAHPASRPRSALRLAAAAIAATLLLSLVRATHPHIAQAKAMLATRCATRLHSTRSLRCSLAFHAQPRHADPIDRVHTRFATCTYSVCACRSAPVSLAHVRHAAHSSLLLHRATTFLPAPRIRRRALALQAHVSHTSRPRIRTTTLVHA